MQSSNRIFLGLTKDKDLPFLQFINKSNYNKKRTKSSKFSRFNNKNKKQMNISSFSSFSNKNKKQMNTSSKFSSFNNKNKKQMNASSKFSRFNNMNKKQINASSFSRFNNKNKINSDFVDYQKVQYKKFFVSRKDYTESINASESFKFRKANHILFLVFCTYFFGLRLISNYD
jgi:hypothetical protein